MVEAMLIARERWGDLQNIPQHHNMRMLHNDYSLMGAPPAYQVRFRTARLGLLIAVTMKLLCTLNDVFWDQVYY